MYALGHQRNILRCGSDVHSYIESGYWLFARSLLQLFAQRHRFTANFSAHMVPPLHDQGRLRRSDVVRTRPHIASVITSCRSASAKRLRILSNPLQKNIAALDRHSVNRTYDGGKLVVS